MKYICTVNGDDVQEIFTFPRTVDHDAMAEVLGRIKNSTHGDWRRVMRTPISAGFVTSVGQCHGEGITLNLSSRDKDTELLAKQMLS